MNKRVSITLSRQAFAHNVRAISSLTGDQSLALVIKSNAYGHGISQIASFAEELSAISFLCTAGISEALPLRKQGITKPILVLSYFEGDIKEAVIHGFHMSVSSLSQAQALSVAAQSVGTRVYIHVKIDTGMGRLGVLPADAVMTIKALSQLPLINVYGVFTHLCDTGHDDHAYSLQQLAAFDEVLEDLEAAGIKIPCTHAQSSSSLDLIPKRKYSFIRAGASLYGLWKNPNQQMLIKRRDPSFDLIPVIEWKAPIIQIKKVPSGSFIGYNRKFVTKRPTHLAIVPVGYFDGYTRALSNKGMAHFKGYRVPVIGIVSMNLTSFDVTDVPSVQVGDELILMGDYEGIRPHEIAHTASCITNEIATGINPVIERTIVPFHEKNTVEQPFTKIIAQPIIF